MIDTIKQDAREYGLHVKGGGWRLGLLVARNVQKGTHKDGPVAVATGSGKVSATVFAKAAGTTNDRVLRHLDAWEKAAKAGVVPEAEKLTPGSEVRLPDAEEWGTYYTSISGGYNGGKDRVPTKALVEQQLDKLSAKDRAALATALVAQTEVREAIAVSGPMAIEQHLDLTGEIIQGAEKESERKLKTAHPMRAARTASDEIDLAIRHLANAQAEIVRWSVTEKDDRMRLLAGSIERCDQLIEEIKDLFTVTV